MRKIVHIDADCFFAAVEIRQRPHLINSAVAVGGHPSGRGVITTCNYPARVFGVRSAMSSAQALRLCPDLQFIEPNFSLYKSVSADLFSILSEYADKLEPVSIDEAYLDVTESHLFDNSATLIARDIQKKVFRDLGISVSAGVAPVKFVAKIASDWNKPHGIFTVEPKHLSKFLSGLELRKLPGVGPKTGQKLQSLGLLSCEDVLRSDVLLLREHFGSFSNRLLDMAKGIDNRSVGRSGDRKSISVERTFSEDIYDIQLLMSKLRLMIENLESRVASVSTAKRALKRVVKIKFSDFTNTSVESRIAKSSSWCEPVEFERLAYAAARRSTLPVRLVGVGLRFAETGNPVQLDLDGF